MMLLGFDGFLAVLVIVFGVINLLIYLQLKHDIKHLNERSGMIFDLFLDQYAVNSLRIDKVEKMKQYPDKLPNR